MKLIVEERVSEDIMDMIITQGGETTGIFNPASGDLEFTFPGIKSPGQPTGSSVTFAWDGYNDNGQEINQGIYYIKMSMTDTYGHVQTRIENIQLMRNEEYVRINIYNSAGELVRRIEEEISSNTIVNMVVDDVLVVGKGVIPIQYTDFGDFLPWDGKNAEGELVSNGIYEIQVEVKTATGYSVVASKTVTILRDGDEVILGDVKAYPNPCLISDVSTVLPTIAWTGAGPGKVKIKIYNIAGELIKEIKEDMAVLSAQWDMSTRDGNSASSGMYVIIIEGLKDSGNREVLSVKFVILKRFNESNVIN